MLLPKTGRREGLRGDEGYTGLSIRFVHQERQTGCKEGQDHEREGLRSESLSGGGLNMTHR